jgi:hypothetical protein
MSWIEDGGWVFDGWCDDVLMVGFCGGGGYFVVFNGVKVEVLW